MSGPRGEPRGEKVTSIREGLRGARAAGGGAKFRVLREDCPVTPLGGDGRVFWYLNAIGQLVPIGAQQHSKNVVSALFAPQVKAWCWEHYPKGVDPDTNRPKDFKVDALVTDLLAEGQSGGTSWDPVDSIFGRGVWPGEDGELRVHLGSHLVVGGKRRAVGKIGAKVYPLRPEWPGPAPDAQAEGAAGPAAELLALLECWHWEERRLAPRLLLGWVVSALLCGALDWRPHMWLIAPRGSGKSTLLKLLGHVLWRGSYLLAAEDASAASLRAALEFDARPVCLDETEPSEDNRRLNDILGLLRIAASGGTAMRATVEQGVVQQTARFSAICASIVRPSFTSQDASRIAVLTMRKPPAGSVEPMLRPEVLALLGRRLLRRALDAWPRWPEVLHAWKDGLTRHGMDNRNRDQFAPLLAFAWLVEWDGLPDSDTLEEWTEACAAVTLPDRQEERPDWFRLIEYLAAITLRDDAGKGEHTVAELLEVACQAKRVPDPEHGGWKYTTPAEADRANALLARHGMRFDPVLDAQKRPVRRPFEPGGEAAHGPMVGHLAVANTHQGLARLLERTRWAARPGSPGAWKSALEGADGAVKGASVRFGPRTSRAVKVPLEHVFDGVSEHE